MKNATQPNGNGRPLRCISWVAVSTKSQVERESPAEQKRRNMEVIERLGGRLVAELEVPGQSRSIILFEDAAREIDAYAELKRLLEDRAADLLIYRDISRLGRKASLSLQVVELCHEAGVALYDRSSPPQALTAAEQSANDAGLITSSIQGAFAQIEVRNLQRRFEYGMQGRIKSGRLPGRPPYGYRRRFRADGTEVVEPVADEALIVQEVFEQYLLGHSPNVIARDLTRRKISSATGKSHWHPTSIFQMLRRAHIYAGFTEWRKPSDKLVIREQGNHPPLISLAVAKETEQEMARRGFVRQPNNQRLLSRVLICDVCGANLVGGGGKDRNIYRCHSCDKAGNPFCSIAETTVMSELEELVRMLYSERNLRKMVKATQSDDDGDVNRHANRIEAAIIQVERERDRVIYAYQNGVIEHDDLEKRLRPLNERREELRRQLSTLQASIGAVETYQERLDRLRDAVSRFGDMLEQMSTPEANRLLRRNFRIYIRPRTVERIEIL